MDEDIVEIRAEAGKDATKSAIKAGVFAGAILALGIWLFTFGGKVTALAWALVVIAGILGVIVAFMTIAARSGVSLLRADANGVSNENISFSLPWNDLAAVRSSRSNADYGTQGNVKTGRGLSDNLVFVRISQDGLGRPLQRGISLGTWHTDNIGEFLDFIRRTAPHVRIGSVPVRSTGFPDGLPGPIVDVPLQTEDGTFTFRSRLRGTRVTVSEGWIDVDKTTVPWRDVDCIIFGTDTLTQSTMGKSIGTDLTHTISVVLTTIGNNGEPNVVRTSLPDSLSPSTDALIALLTRIAPQIPVYDHREFSTTDIAERRTN